MPREEGEGGWAVNYTVFPKINISTLSFLSKKYARLTNTKNT